MPDSDAVALHYTRSDLLEAFQAALERLGKSPESVTVEDLGPAEEFHIGGREASLRFLDQLDLSPDDHVLDVGCGIGGTSRFTAHRYGSRVTGIDLTLDYVETGRVLCTWVNLAHRVTLEHASATELPFGDGGFDKAYMLHVGMNIPDKQMLMAELYRVLKPGARLGVYDVMRTGDGDLTLPVPWAATPEASVLGTPQEYKQALETAGFRVVAEENRREFALDFFARLQARISAAGGPPPLGLHLLMGETAPVKIKNMVENIAALRVAPVELIAEKLP